MVTVKDFIETRSSVTKYVWKPEIWNKKLAYLDDIPASIRASPTADIKFSGDFIHPEHSPSTKLASLPLPFD
jgi:hypothetical protein